MSTGVQAALYIDGQRFADGSTGADPADPVALSGLSVDWGRDTTVDQPAASTCSFQIADRTGGQSFIDILRTGLPVAVTATGIEWPAPTTETFLDPGFEGTGPLALVAINAAAARSADRPHTGARSLRLDPIDPTRRAGALLAPAPFAPNGQDAGAWDAIPQTAPGQQWALSAWIYAPAFAAAQVRPVLFSGPWANAATPAGPWVPVTPGSWQQAHMSLATGRTGSWVGLEVSVFPTGARWVDATGTWAQQGGTWLGRAALFVDDIAVLAPTGGLPRTVLVFAGRVTSLRAQWDDTIDGPLIDVTATDFLADLANRDVGDEPWAVEAMGDRFNRILTLAGLPIAADIDASVYGIPVTWQDVDNQAATGLLQELAVSVDAVMWSATHQTTGAYLRVEDPAQRAPMFRLEMVGELVQIVPIEGVGMALDACDVLRDPIEFEQDVNDVTTRAAVGWLEQTVDNEGNPATADHTVTVIDHPLEQKLGTRRISVSTKLIDEGDARDVANRLLARLTELDWRASGFVVDDYLLDDAAPMLTLLDGTSRIGLPLRVVGMPDWSPAGDTVPLYLEGGKWSYDAGRWVLDLTVSSARGQGQSATWAELDPAWRWIDVDPAISWADAFGVAGPELEAAA